MASPQKENGYTPIANELLEAIYAAEFTNAQLKVLLCVLRYTYGFSRKECELSLSFISDAVKVSARHVKRVLNTLITQNVIVVVKECSFTDGRILSFNKDYETWQCPQGTPVTPGDMCVPSTGDMDVTPRGDTGVPQDKQYIKQYKKELSSELAAGGSDGVLIRASPGKKREPRQYDPDSVYYKAAHWLAAAIYKRKPDHKEFAEDQLQDWANDARLMVERDKRDLVKMREVLIFSQNDTFWRKNILSMGAFRKQFDRLDMEREEQRTKRQAVKSGVTVLAGGKYLEDSL